MELKATQPADTRPLFTALAKRLERKSGAHLYRQFQILVRDEIAQGRLRPGDTIPPQRELSQLTQISEVTLRRALQQLADEGFVEARPGTGTVVLPPAGTRSQTTRSDSNTLTIGIAFANLASGYPFFQPMVQGIRRDNSQPVAIRVFDLPDATDALPDLTGLDALVMMSPVSTPLIAACQRQRIPCVLLYTDIADGYSRCIVVDYTPGVFQSIQHLTSRGRSRIAVVTAGAERFSTGRLLDAYHSALELHGLPANPDWIIHGGYDEQHGHAATRKLMQLADRPDAILFASDHPARGGLIAAHDLNISVPDQLAVIGAGRLIGPQGWPTPLSTIDLQFEEVGALARQTIEALLAGRQPPFRQSVRSSLIVGQTS